MTKDSPRIAQRKSPHITAENFRAEMRPTLINYEDEFLAYDADGAYRLIKDKTMKAEAQTYLEGAQEMRPTKNGMKPFDFNPKTADAEELASQLGRKYHFIAPSNAAPPFFLSGDYEIDYSTFLDPHDVIACRNGLLQISTRELYGSTSQFFTRTALPIDFDPDARPVRWLTFLDEVLGGDVELILLVQQMFGLFISTETKRQAIFYFRGVSGSGKSTIMRVLDALIGERNICNPSIADLAERSTLNDMTGKTLAKITDLNASNPQHLSEAASNLNRISGGDRVHVFRKFKEGLEVKLGVRFLMAGNQFPNFGEHATALARRLKVIPFNRSFEDNPDPDLSDTLIAELPGILNWALDGFDSLRADGFVEPAASLVAKKSILNSGDPLRSFVTDECTVDLALEVNKDELFRRYLLHCQTIGVKMPLSKPKFIAALMTAFNGIRPARPRTDDGGREQVMVGIGLKDCNRLGEPAPTITYRLDPDMLGLFERTDPEAMMRGADGKPIELATTDFDE